MGQQITDDQFRKVLQLVKRNPNPFIARRNTLLLETQYLLGLRPMEARCIMLEHLDFQAHTLFIPADHNKEHNADIFPIPKILLRKIKLWIAQRPFHSRWLFPSYLNQFRKKDVPVHARAHQREFTAAARQLHFAHCSFIDQRGMPRYNLNLYSLRRNFATRAYTKFRDVKKLATLLRHYDPQCRATMGYVQEEEKSQRHVLMRRLYN